MKEISHMTEMELRRFRDLTRIYFTGRKDWMTGKRIIKQVDDELKQRKSSTVRAVA